jgi:Cache 3/Cache 2 fusion domain
MTTLKSSTAKLGAPKVEGMEAVSGKDAAALYFGTTKINNNFDVVDAVVKENGGTATLFAKTGDEYVRVSTNVPKPDMISHNVQEARWQRACNRDHSGPQR